MNECDNRTNLQLKYDTIRYDRRD